MTRKKTATSASDVTELKSEFAARLGLTRGRVSQMVAAGLPVTDAGRVPIAEALAWVESNIDQAASGGGADDLRAAKVRLTTAQAQLAELTAREREGALIEREIARRVTIAFVRLQRDTILQFAAREGPGLAADLGVDPRLLIGKLDAALRDMLIRLTETPMPYSGEAWEAANHA